MPYFTLLGRPTLVFQAVNLYAAAYVVPSVRGVTLDGEKQACARIVDVVWCDANGRPLY
jgi:hypothetical protein